MGSRPLASGTAPLGLVAWLGLLLGGCGRLGYEPLVASTPDAARADDGPPDGPPDGAIPDAPSVAPDRPATAGGGDAGAGPVDVEAAAPDEDAGAGAAQEDAAAPASDAPRDAGGLACPAGCACPSYAGRPYALCREALPQAAAARSCARAGGHLVWIDDAEENAWLRAAADRHGLGEVWLGGSDATEEGTWRWGDGAPFWSGSRGGRPVDGRFANWSPGEPNELQGGEDCLLMWAMGLWNDSLCEPYRVAYACEAF